MNSVRWNAAVGSANTDPGTVALRAKDDACNAAGLTQAACEADSSGWCAWTDFQKQRSSRSTRLLSRLAAGLYVREAAGATTQQQAITTFQQALAF